MKYTIDKANDFIGKNKDSINKTYRHKFHLMPLVGWMNDPNGFIHYNGHYHLFFQHYPYKTEWGPMHWGHAKSKDLITWTHLPVALAPDLPHEDGCFSGGAIEHDGKLLLMYTSHYDTNFRLEEQSLAISNNEIVFNKTEKPIITANDLPKNSSKENFRDPNPIVINGEIFILIGNETKNHEGQILVYKTTDFKSFSLLNIIKHPLFGQVAECPDLFELNGKHVLLFSATNLEKGNNSFKNINSSLYAIGNFNTKTGEFIFEHIGELDAGHHFYAPQTTSKNERLLVAWMEMWHKPYYTALNGHNWVGAITLPRILNVRNNRLYQEPFNIDKYVIKEIDISKTNTIKTYNYFILEGTIKTNNETVIFIGSNDDLIKLIINKKEVILDTSNTSLYPLEARSINHNLKEINFKLIMDNSSLELFVKDVDKTITTRVYMKSDISFITHDNKVLKRLVLKELDK